MLYIGIDLGTSAVKLLWMQENEPDLFARISKIMLPKDYINYILTGVHCTDYTPPITTVPFFPVSYRGSISLRSTGLSGRNFSRGA